VTDFMAARIRLALSIAHTDVVAARFRDAYQRGGTPTSTHLVTIAAAAGTTPIWLMTGWPAAHAPTNAKQQTTDNGAARVEQACHGLAALEDKEPNT
jgi:hypothetical protein